MKLNDLDAVHIRAARPLRTFQSGSRRPGIAEALMTRLMRAWIGLYAAPPRRPLPPL